MTRELRDALRNGRSLDAAIHGSFCATMGDVPRYYRLQLRGRNDKLLLQRKLLWAEYRDAVAFFLSLPKPKGKREAA